MINRAHLGNVVKQAIKVRKQEDVVVRQCVTCGGYTLWVKKELVYPEESKGASEYMPEDVKIPFMEAQKVIGNSPWAACIFLRTALDKLLTNHLKAKGKTLYEKLKRANLDESLFPLADVCRLVGNDAAHDANLDYQNADSQLPIFISELINYIVEREIGYKIKSKELSDRIKGHNFVKS